MATAIVNLGSGMTGPTFSFDQAPTPTHAAFAFMNIISNDLKLGVRWSLESPPVYAPPLITKG